MSRRRRAGLILLSLLLVVVFIRLDHNIARNKWQRQPQSSQQAKSRDFEKYHGKTFNVINIVDGDTIDIDIFDSQNNHTRIRLWGIDTPETKHPKVGVLYFGPQAADFTKELVLGKQVRIYLDEDKSSRGKYGRLLAYVQLPDKKFLNELLLTEGYAYADLRFRHSFYHKYSSLESGARSRKKGLWQEVTREQLPQWLQRKKPKLLKYSN